MVTPGLKALRAAFPKTEITLAGRPNARELVEGAAWCDRFATEIERGRYDAAVLIPHSFRVAWEAWRAGVPVRAGFKGEFRGWLLTHRVRPPRGDRRKQPWSKLTYLRLLLEGLGIRVEDMSLELPLDAASEGRAEAFLREVGLDPARPLVALNPGSAFGPSKRWPEEYFAQTGDALARRLGGSVYILAGPDEEEEARRIASKMTAGPVVLGADLADLRMIKSIVKRTAVMVSNDSGPRHIAACYDIPCVVLVGPFHPALSYNGHLRTAMMWEGVECSPCHLRVCPIDHRCMTRLTPERVVEEATRLVNARRGSAG
jgi:heptosyltransferase-2